MPQNPIDTLILRHLVSFVNSTWSSDKRNSENSQWKRNVMRLGRKMMMKTGMLWRLEFHLVFTSRASRLYEQV